MKMKETHIVRYSHLSLLAPNEIETLVLDTLGIKATVKRANGKTLIMVEHYNSCFEVMKKLRFDFDYSVHKKGKKYIFEI